MTAQPIRRVVLGVTGGIAAYKGAELVRRLRERGLEVRVVMTEAATRFVSPLTFQALSGQPVAHELFDPRLPDGMDHIELGRWADRIVVAPASADFIARLAHGLADDLLATVCLAAEVPTLLAPAMNQRMWLHPSTRSNCRVLEERGVSLLGPAQGGQACGEVGPGRMLEPEELVERLLGPTVAPALVGLRLVVSAGPTREALDPVRFLSNRSSGKMGHALAAAAAEAGASVTLVSGPVSLSTPHGVARVDVVTADEMCRAVLEAVQDADIYVAAAAVADYRPVRVADEKLEKRDERMFLELEPTPDILARVASQPRPPFTVGFAAQTHDLEAHARAKLSAKSLDMVAANRVGGARGGFDSDENALEVFWEGGHRFLEMKPKGDLARELLALIAERYREKRSTADSRPTHRS